MAQKTRLERLSVSGFRGVLETRTLEFSGKSIVLFGENGTGKSTFVDALERLFAGRISTLDGRGQGLSSQQHARHIHAPAADLSVEVQFTDSAISKISLASDLGALQNTALGPYIEGAKTPVYILRRRNLLEIIDSQPRQRYELLRPFLPLREIDAVEDGLRSLAEGLDATDSRLSSKLRADRSRVVSMLELEPASTSVTDSDVLSALQGRLHALDQEGPANLDDFSQVELRLDRQIESFGDTSIAQTSLGLWAR